MAKSNAEKHVRFFHSDDRAAGEAETEAERLEHDAVIDRFVHLTNAKGLPHNEELHRLVHHGPAADVAGGDIENDFPVPDNVSFKKIAPGGSDVTSFEIHFFDSIRQKLLLELIPYFKYLNYQIFFIS